MENHFIVRYAMQLSFQRIGQENNYQNVTVQENNYLKERDLNETPRVHEDETKGGRDE